MPAGGQDIGLSTSDALQASQNNPTSINIAGSSSPVTWLVIGAIVIMGLIVWFRLKKGK